MPGNGYELLLGDAEEMEMRDGRRRVLAIDGSDREEEAGEEEEERNERRNEMEKARERGRRREKRGRRGMAS